MNLWDSVSLLMAEGHACARRYAVSQVWQEARIVSARINARLASEAILVQSAIVSALSEDGARSFSKMVERLNRK